MSAGGRRITGRTVLFAMLGFFGVVFAANIVFVWLASETWSGLSTDNAYRKGIEYNATLERGAAQQALGWQAETSLREADGGGRILTLRLRDADDRPIDGREVAATFRRPVAEGSDFTVPLAWSGAGLYEAEIAPPELGQWDLRIEIAREDAPAYLVETRLWLK